jgi:hypothetical protein
MWCSKFATKTPAVKLYDPKIDDYTEFETMRSGLGNHYVREVKAYEYTEKGQQSEFYLIVYFSTVNKKGQLMVCCAYNWRVTVPEGKELPRSVLLPDITTRFEDKSEIRLISCKRVIGELEKMEKVCTANPFTTNGHGWDSFDMLNGGCCEYFVMGMMKTRFALKYLLDHLTAEELFDIVMTSPFTRWTTLYAINNKLSFEERYVDRTPRGLSEAELKLFKADQLVLQRKTVLELENKEDFKLAVVQYYMETILKLEPTTNPVIIKEEVGRGTFLGTAGAHKWDKVVGLAFLHSTCKLIKQNPLNLGILMTTLGAYKAEYNNFDERFGVRLPFNGKMGVLFQSHGLKFLLDDTKKRGQAQEQFLAELKRLLDGVLDSLDDETINSNLDKAVEMLTLGIDEFGVDGNGILGLVKSLYLELCIGNIVFPLELHQRLASVFEENGLGEWSLDLPEVNFDDGMMEPYDLLLKVGVTPAQYETITAVTPSLL